MQGAGGGVEAGGIQVLASRLDAAQGLGRQVESGGQIIAATPL